MATNDSWTSSPRLTSEHEGLSTTTMEVTRPLTSDLKECQVCTEMLSVTQEYFVLQLLFPTVTLAANALTSVAVFRARSMKSTLRVSFLNLSLTDILASLLYMYHIAFSWTAFKFDIECVVRYALYVLSIILGMVTIQVMTVERFISVFVPYHYEKINGRHFVTVCISVPWIIASGFVVVGFAQLPPDIAGCFYPMLVKPEIHLLYGLASCFNLTTIIVFNALVYGYTRIQITKIAATLVGDQRQERIARLETKATMTTIYVVVPFVLMNLPMVVLQVYFYFAVDFTTTSDALFIVNGLSSLSLVNSLMNPGIYIWRSRPVREELKGMKNQLLSLISCGKCTKDSSAEDRRRT